MFCFTTSIDLVIFLNVYNHFTKEVEKGHRITCMQFGHSPVVEVLGKAEEKECILEVTVAHEKMLSNGSRCQEVSQSENKARMEERKKRMR